MYKRNAHFDKLILTEKIMKKQKMNEILPETDLKHPGEIKKRIADIDEAKTLIIYGATNSLEGHEDDVLETLKKLTWLQSDLYSLKKNIEAYENKK